MKRMLSVFFNSDSTYLTVVEPTKKGLSLVYINSTENAVDLENFLDDSTLRAADELKDILHEINNGISRLSVTLPSENVLVAKFPGKSKMTEEDMRKLVEIEIKQAYPQFNYNDFISTVIPLQPKLDGAQIMMAVIISKQNFISCAKLLQPLNQPILNIEISQLNAHSAFLYNYPEQLDKTVALLGMQNQFIDVSVIKEGKPIYYNLLSFRDVKSIAGICESEFTKILSEYVTFIDSAYFFGEGLTKDILEQAKLTLSGLVMTTDRLNAFRMMTTDLEPRLKDYCTRVAHIFPPCVGGNLPAYHDKIKLF